MGNANIFEYRTGLHPEIVTQESAFLEELLSSGDSRFSVPSTEKTPLQEGIARMLREYRLDPLDLAILRAIDGTEATEGRIAGFLIPAYGHVTDQTKIGPSIGRLIFAARLSVLESPGERQYGVSSVGKRILDQFDRL